MMIYAYVRISKDKQTTENQRFEILKFADEKRLQINEWVDETVTGVKMSTPTPIWFFQLFGDSEEKNNRLLWHVPKTCYTTRVGNTWISVLGPPGNGETGFGNGKAHHHGHLRESAL